MDNVQQFMKGDIFYMNLGRPNGCIQGGYRPVVVIQNNIGNRHSPTLQVAPVTKSKTKAKLPTHVGLRKGMGGLKEDSIVLVEQTTIRNKSELLPENKLGHLDDSALDRLDEAIAIQFGLNNCASIQRHTA